MDDARQKTRERHCVTIQRLKMHHGRPGRVVLLAVPLLLVSTTASAQTLTMQQLLSNHIDQRFGMFIHYNMNTYYYGWGEKRVDPKTLAPPSGDCHTFTEGMAVFRPGRADTAHPSGQADTSLELVSGRIHDLHAVDRGTLLPR
jgi:hypothetical protein